VAGLAEIGFHDSYVNNIFALCLGALVAILSGLSGLGIIKLKPEHKTIEFLKYSIVNRQSSIFIFEGSLSG
jgi:hypothetical protein